AFNVPYGSIQEINPGYALIAKKDGRIYQEVFREPVQKRSCSFERIYFSRGSDAEIYQERKQLGKLLCPQVLEAVDYNIKDTVFSYIPNTAEVAFFGMEEGISAYVRNLQTETLLNRSDKIGDEEMNEMLSITPRFEKLNIKDAKLRTFITQDAARQDMVQHVYDTTYGIVRDHQDSIVAMDDSIVRGTTLKESILTILDRLNPKKII